MPCEKVKEDPHIMVTSPTFLTSIRASADAEVDLQWTHAEDIDIMASSEGEVEKGSTKRLTIQANSKAEVEMTVADSATGSVVHGAKLKLCGYPTMVDIDTDPDGKLKYC